MNYVIGQILEEILGKPQDVNQSTGQYRFDCPFCSLRDGLNGKTDGKGNLEINTEESYDGGKGVYNCWSCGQSHGTHGGLLKLISQLGNKSHYNRYISELSQLDKDFVLGRNRGPVVIKKVPNGIKEVKLYDVYKSLYLDEEVKTNTFKKGLEYLLSRGINKKIIEKYRVRCCDTFEKIDGLRSFYGRIIFPSFDVNGKVNYFVARDCLGRNKKYKYQNPEIEKEEIIFNEYFINWDADIYLVEGVTDHIVVPNSIPMLGKKVSDLLFRTLQEKAKGNIIIFLDDDAFKDILAIYDKLNIGNLRGRIRLIKIEKIEGVDLDPSKINELWGAKYVLKYMRTQRPKNILDKLMQT